MIRRSSYNLIALAFAATLGVTTHVSAQTVQPTSSEAASIAIESDILSFFISGYSGIVNLSLANGFQTAFGVGRYDVPSFLVEGDANFDAAQWTATVPSVQVFRATYRFRGPDEEWSRVRIGRVEPKLAASVGAFGRRDQVSDPQSGTDWRLLYSCRQALSTFIQPPPIRYNKAFGETSIRGVNYHVERFAPNASLHVGWEWGL